jgi:hypothetical protein
MVVEVSLRNTAAFLGKSELHRPAARESDDAHPLGVPLAPLALDIGRAANALCNIPGRMIVGRRTRSC